MFELTLVDHLRLTFGHVIYRHRLHAKKARLYAGLSRWLKVAEAVLMTAVTYTALATALGRGPRYAIACGVLAAVTLTAMLLQLILNSDVRAQVHNAAAAQLWHIREQYQALLSDIADSATTPEAARKRRDALGDDLQVIYETAPPVPHDPHEKTAHAAVTDDEAAMTDDEIDRFLPKSLHKLRRQET